MRNFILALIICSATPYLLPGQENTNGNFTASINPAYWALGGYSIRGHYILPKKWSFGLVSEAGFSLPAFARDQFFKNQNDIEVDWDYLFGLEVRYRFTEASIDKGLYLLAATGYEGWTIENDAGATDDFSNWYASLGVGYLWYPFKKERLSLGANYNLIFLLNNTDERFAGESVYQLRPVVPPSLIPSLSLGWRFN